MYCAGAIFHIVSVAARDGLLVAYLFCCASITQQFEGRAAPLALKPPWLSSANSQVFRKLQASKALYSVNSRAQVAANIKYSSFQTGV
eukprot:1857292-Pleurochrysis_carterae.AAC.2